MTGFAGSDEIGAPSSKSSSCATGEDSGGPLRFCTVVHCQSYMQQNRVGTHHFFWSGHCVTVLVSAADEEQKILHMK